MGAEGVTGADGEGKDDVSTAGNFATVVSSTTIILEVMGTSGRETTGARWGRPTGTENEVSDARAQRFLDRATAGTTTIGE